MTPTTSPEARVRPISPLPDPVAEVEDPPYFVTPEQEARFAAYMAKPKVLPKSAIDRATGRALPASEEERAVKWREFKRRMAEIDASGEEDPPGAWVRMAREINEERALDGRGPAFAEHEICE